MEIENVEKVVSMPRIGDEAPSFRAVTTQGDINFLKIIQDAGSFYSASLQIGVRVMMS